VTISKKAVEDDVEVEWQQKGRAYVLFYASWCPYSQRFLQIFREYEKTNPDECVEVIIDSKPDLCDKYEINYYPTVLVFKKGKLHKRLDAVPGKGLTKTQLEEFTEDT
jgi:thiol-disulfide isomerase/thioredoxin